MRIEELREPAEKQRVARQVLEQLPQWFGIPQAREEYIRQCGGLPVFAARAQGQWAWFLAVKRHSEYAAEIEVMGVLPTLHRRGLGRALVERCIAWCRQQGIRFLQVKTLDASNPDENYAGTRRFYKAMGFYPLECIPTLWGESNPCLIMIQYLE